jgi:hypothetical protein
MPPVKVPGAPDNYYQSLSAACTHALPGSSLTMEAQATTFSENFNLNNAVNLLLHGGFDATYASNPGYSILHGILTIVNGSLTIEQFMIQ